MSNLKYLWLHSNQVEFYTVDKTVLISIWAPLGAVEVKLDFVLMFFILNRIHHYISYSSEL